MKSEQVTIKATPKSLSLLRQIAAITGDKQYKVLDRLLEQEFKRINKDYGG